MSFPIHIDILELIIKGIIIGIAASAPMGPVGILCVQRTQKKGRWYGFATGVGASISDLIYALISGFGMSFVVNFINNPVYKFYLQLAGGVMLLVFGLISFFSNPLKNAHEGGQKEKGTLIHNGVTAFLITFSNPLIILLFIALFAQFNFIIPKEPLLMCGLRFHGGWCLAVVVWTDMDDRQDPYQVRSDRCHHHQPSHWQYCHLLFYRESHWHPV